MAPEKSEFSQSELFKEVSNETGLNDSGKRENQHLWDQFIRLGERIGDGDLGEDERWMNKEYKRLMLKLNPDIKDAFKQKRLAKNKRIDDQLLKLIEAKVCTLCGSKLVQSRSGSLILKCTASNCKGRFKAVSVKKKQ